MSKTTWQDRRLFLSSTFRDFHAERDHLHEVVFPALEERLRQRRCHLVPVDLRWGIATGGEAEADAKELMVLKVCLGEIDRCKPFLLVLLGDRYGWVPPGTRMTAASREAGFDADLDGKSVTALEVEYGVLAHAAGERRAFVYVREPLPYHDMPASVATTFSELHAGDADAPERNRKLLALKERVTREMPERVRRYAASWDAEHQRVTGLAAWGLLVLDDLWSVLDADTADAENARPATWQEEERTEIEAFVEHRGRLVLGRDAVLDALQAKALSQVADDASWGTVVVAEPGSGKSAVFAALSGRLSAQTDVLVLAQVAGISTRAGSIDALLRRFCQELATATNRADPCTDPMGFEQLQQAFAELLSRTATTRRVVVLLDALNEFEQTPVARHLTWLPEHWPRNARLISMTLPGQEAEALGKRHGVERVDLEPLGAADARAITQAVCARYRKTLPTRALDALLGRTAADGSLACGRPLWLHLAIQDLLLFDEEDFARAASYGGTAEQQLEALLADAARDMPAEIQGLYGMLLDRAEDVHGAEWARAFAELVATSRHGLRETDLQVLMPALSGNAWDPLRFANLRRGFRAHVVLRGAPARWDFFHGQMREAIGLRDLADAEQRKQVHAAIAAHLAELDASDPVRCAERMAHLVGADDAAGAVQAYARAEGTELAGASMVLADAAALPELHGGDGVEWVCGLLEVEVDDTEQRRPLHRFNFDLYDALARVCKLAVRKRIAGAVVSGWQRLVQLEPENTDYLRDLSVSLSKMGGLDERTDSGLARAWFKQSLEIARRLVQLEPDNTEYLRDLWISFIKMGGLDERTDPGLARAWFKQSLEIARRLVQLEPDNTQYLRDLSISFSNMGGLDARTDPGLARAWFEQGLEVARRLLQLEPDNTQYVRDLSISFSNMGRLDARTDPGLARAWFEKGLENRRSLVQLEPDNTQYLRDLSVSFNEMGGLDERTDPGLARAWFERGLEIARRLVQLEPENTWYLRDLTFSFSNMGKLDERTDPGLARAWFEQCLEIRRRLVQLEPDNTQYLRDLSVSFGNMGGLDERTDTGKARAWSEQGMEIARRLVQLEPENTDYLRDLSIWFTKMGGLDACTDPGLARARFEQCLEIRRRLVQLEPDNTRYLRDLCVSYHDLTRVCRDHGRRTEAESHLAGLLAALHEMDRRAALTEPALRQLLDWDPFATLSTQPAPQPAHRPVVDRPQAHHSANPDGAFQLNLAHQEALRTWHALPWYARLVSPKPQPPTGI